MRILFDKAGNGTVELQELTGSYWASNDFSRIKMDILLESEKIADLVGDEVYSLAEVFYHEDPDGGVDYTSLLQHLQFPIAMMATFRYSQSNLMSHEDGGRKLKVDKENEATPWEWMFDRDDEAQLRKAYLAIDRLIRFLDKSNLEAWLNSDRQKATRSLFISNTQAFHERYPIDESPRFFYAILPFIREVQIKTIAPLLGKVKYDELLDKYQGNDGLTESEQTLLNLVQDAIPLLSMVTAIKRLSLRVLPEGVVQQFRSMLQGRHASQPATMDVIKQFTNDLENDAKKVLLDIRKELDKDLPEPVVYDLLPKNSEANKYFRT